MEAFLVTINNLAAIMAITFAISIMLHSVSKPFHKSIAVLLLITGVSYILRAYAYQTLNPQFEALAHIGFVFVMLGLFICFFIYRFVDIQFLNKRDRSVLRLLFYAGVLSILFHFSSVLFQRGIVGLDISSFTALISIHAIFHLSRHYGAGDILRVKEELRLILQCFAFSLITTGFLFLGGVIIFSVPHFFAITAIVYSCALFSLFVFRQLLVADSKFVLEALGRHSLVKRDSLPQYLRDLARSDFFAGIEVMREAGVEYHKMDVAYRILRSGEIYNSFSIQKRLKDQHTPLVQLRGYIALYKLLKLKDAQAVIMLGSSKDLLFLRQEPLSSVYVFYALVSAVAQAAEKFDISDEEKAKLIAVNFDIEDSAEL